MNTIKRVYIASNGCNRRLLDADRVKRYFLLNGWILTDSPKTSDYNLFFASALNRVRIDESFDIIERLTRYPGETIVLGCIMEVAPTEFRERWNGKFLAVKDMNEIDLFFPGFETKYRDVTPGNTPVNSGNIYKAVSPEQFLKQRLTLALNPSKIGDKLYSFVHRQQKENYDTTFIWVSNGCPNKCSFCAERKVIGDLQSRPVNEIVSEYGKLLDEGRRNFEFIGDDVGSYGLDIRSSLPELIAGLNRKDAGYPVHWVIKHLHPKFIIKYQDDLIELARSGKVREIICCFQTGSNRLLDLMNRQHTIEEVITTLKRFRQVLPDIKLATNIIVGFPTETDEEFNQTLAVFDEVYFDRVHMIKYYDAEGSDSHELNPKVSDESIARRIWTAKKFLKQREIYFQTRD
jgi:tRNA A37 methylthiotransferase MiaB